MPSLAISSRIERSKKLQKRGRISQKKNINQEEANMDAEKGTGTIKTLKEQGFGFIAREGEEKDLFFHTKNLVGVTFEELKEGDAVSFEIVQEDKGPNAVNVQRA